MTSQAEGKKARTADLAKPLAPDLRPDLPPALAKALARTIANRMSASLLPGDAAFSPKALAAGSAFVFDTIVQRETGQAKLALESVSSDETGRLMRIVIINDDMPFLVDSVAAAIAAHGLVIDRLVHPILVVRRDASGNLVDMPAGNGAGEKRESLIYLETDRVDARQRRALEESLREALIDVRAAVEDWPQMRTRMQEDAETVADGEGAALMRWMAGGMMTQLGHLIRKRGGKVASRLGICRSSAASLLADETFERAFLWFENGVSGEKGRAPLIIKANRLSHVHRRVPLDLFIIPILKDGKIDALSLHAGIWTSAALNTPPGEIPRLRSQMTRLMGQLGFEPQSHDGKALAHALTTLPHDLVIGFGEKAIERISTTMMALVDRPRPRLALVEAPLERHLFAFAWLPRDMISTQARLEIIDFLEDRTNARVLDWSLEVEGGNLALLRFVLDMRDANPGLDPDALDAQLQQLLRGWNEAVEAELAKDMGPSRAAAISDRYAGAFPPPYRSAYGPAEAALDIKRLRAISVTEGAPEQGRDARLYRLARDGEDRLRLKIYQIDGTLPLSDAVPALENFGFRVLSETPTPLNGDDLDCEECAAIHDFTLALPAGSNAAQISERAAPIETAIANVLNGRTENDVFNHLIVASGLSEQETEWVRAFYRYLRQTGTSFTIHTVCDALNNAPQVTAGLIDLFRARFDPAFQGDRAKAQAAASAQIQQGLADVSAINDDRLLRLYESTISAILRTNAFAPAAREALAFKLDSSAVPGLPRPVPWREIFVYSRRMEGIHLRAGPVARGGIRWSDRRDDFRTEVLGLMKAQRVKNAVIVPTGAKGGFYPKQLPSPAQDRDAWAAEGQASYELYIRSLLSVTDNIIANKVVHPDDVRILDGEDPYFVVAADKGTARFSDIANKIAQSHDFWLDDAFASGGSNGYDHKAMGITARGAWLSVQRHFIEMGVDVQKDPVKVAGCGDMSGDVFGNGMLLSKAIKLVAAFDHRHIFIDPDPDPATSWKERKRLFDKTPSNWDDYKKDLISKGGGVFPRSLKTIPLSSEMRQLLDVQESQMDPETLISAILKAPVDLMWFGGIGTYIKGAAQNNIEVGDRANDALRINGRDLRAKVIGEGANLGCTQAGRIEYALRGGRLNTDFIDNSAGVDCSDNEVNIKIALAAAKRARKLTEPERVTLLAAMTDEVAGIVLEDNRLQALALSIAEAGGPDALPSYIRTIEMLEERGELDRETEGLAQDDELLRRASDGRGLTRPELAVLLSSTKLMMQDAIETSTLDEDDLLVPMLMAAFPQPVQDAFGKQILEHRLRGELVATKLSNRIINRLGLIHPFELAEEEGASLAHVAAAFACAEELFGLAHVWSTLDKAKMPETARLLLFDHLALATRIQMADLLRAGVGTRSSAKIVKDLAPGVKALSGGAKGLLATESLQHSARIRARLVAAGAPAKETDAVVHLFDLDGSVGITRLAVDSGIDAVKLTSAFTDLGGRLGLDWAQARASIMAPSDPWERVLVAGLSRDFQQMRLDFLRVQAREKKGRDNPVQAVSHWAENHDLAIGHFRSMVERAQTAAAVSPAMLAQIAGQARNLLNR